MTSNLVKTIAYLDPQTRQLLDAHAEKTGLSISQAVRECVVEKLEGRMTIERGEWAELALRILLRYHPGGDLEKLTEQLTAARSHERLRG